MSDRKLELGRPGGETQSFRFGRENDELVVRNEDGNESRWQIEFETTDEIILRDEQGQRHRAFFARAKDRVYFALGGRSYSFERRVQDLGAAAGVSENEVELNAPMTGKVVSVEAQVGDEIAEGATVVVVEAMKMEHRLKAPFPARVVNLDAESGALVDMGQTLARLERIEED